MFVKPARKILFITRKFPPRQGGMERVARDLYLNLSSKVSVELVKWDGSNKWLPLVLPYLLFYSVFVSIFKRVDTVYLQDGMLSPIGFVHKLAGKRVVITVHGTDIIFDNWFYQRLIPRFMGRADKIICISMATRKECLVRGIPEDKIEIIPNAIHDEFYLSGDRQTIKKGLSDRLGIEFQGKRVLLSVGRVVEHKGFHWFVKEVVPDLTKISGEFIYLIVGEGNYTSRIRRTIVEMHMEDRVFLTGGVDEQTLKELYNVADIFVMPNIPVEGIMEGFGVVILEAASCCLPVVASNLQGISDAVTEGRNGFLVAPGDSRGFVSIITSLLADERARTDMGAQARAFTLDNYGWPKITERYTGLFSNSGIT